MLAEMTAAEFLEWQEYFGIEPWGEDRADWRQAQTTALLANVHRRKQQRPFAVSDFVLDTRTAAEKQRREAIRVQAEARFKEIADKARAKRRSGVTASPDDGSSENGPGHGE